MVKTATVTDELRIEISADTGNATQNISNTADALSKFGDNAKSADSDVTKLVRAMSDTAASMVAAAHNISQSVAGISALQTGSDTAGSALTGLNMRIDALGTSLQNVDLGAAAASVQSLASVSESSAAALSEIVSATDGFSSRMGELQTNTQGSADSMAELQRGLNNALTSIHSFSDNMDSAGKDAQDTTDKIRALSLQLKAIPTSQPAALASGFRTLKAVVATLGVGKFLKDSNDAYNVQMTNELKLTAHMKHRMQATDEEIRAVKDLTAAQQKLGIIGDEIQLAGAQQLTTYAKQSSTLQTLIPAMNNLIAQNAGYEASVGDATSAADMLGRALNGQYTSLTRAGVTFTEAQEQILKYGTESQKAAVLADAINSKVGNLNELLAQTPTGQLKQLQNDFGDLQEEIGATFQPLISAIVPVARSVMETLREPILNVSRGISTIGAVISSADPAFVRGIALAAGGAAVLNLLRKTIGGTSAGLLVLGVVLAGIIGSMQEEQVSVNDVVANAMRGAEKATDSAENAMEGYNEQIENTERSINRLAGFDTITKLSGGSSGGAITNTLFGDSGLSDLEFAAQTAKDLNDIFDNMESPQVDFNNLEEEILNVGELFKKAFSLDPDEQIEGLRGLDAKLEQYLGDLYTKTFRPIGVSLGEGFYHGVQAAEKLTKGDLQGAAQEELIAQSKFAQLNPFLSKDQREAANRVEADIVNSSSQTAYDLDQALAKPQEDALKAFVNVMNTARDQKIDALDWMLGDGFDLTWMHDVNNDIDKMYTNIGNGVYDAVSAAVGNSSEFRYQLGQFSVKDFNDDVIEELKKGLMPTEAVEAAKNAYLVTDDLKKWYEGFVNLDMSTVSQWRENLLANGELNTTASPEKTSSGRGDIPLRSTDWVSGGTPQLNISLTAYVDGVEHDARIDNDKGW